MAEGDFPKTDGDILYGSEVNRFNNINGIAVFSDLTDYNTSATSFTSIKTLTIGGSISGKSLITICIQIQTDDGTLASIQTLDEANNAYINSEHAWGSGDESDNGWLIFTALVEDGDVLDIQAKRTTSGSAGITELQIFTGTSNLTIT